MSLPLRIGAVSYLNTKPLVYGLRELAPQARLEFDVPSRLADGLAAGKYDVALIPSVEYFARPQYRIVSDACIACRGPVWSVKLLSRVPPAEIRTLALDEGSRTSAALVRILLAEQLGVRPQVRPLPLESDIEQIEADALLLIGDRAMHVNETRFHATWDLGEAWVRHTGLPFVFAMWVARAQTSLSDLAAAFSAARDAGLANLETISRAEASEAGLTPEACLSYLRENLYFRLGERELRGLNLFREHCQRAGFVPDVGETETPRRAAPHACSTTAGSSL